MITFVLWKWRQHSFRELYTAEHVNAMTRMIAANYRGPHRVICVTDNVQGIACQTYPLWKDMDGVPNISGQHLPSCYRRLKAFDPATLDAMGIERGTRVVSIDLDTVIVKDITSLFERDERIVCWRVPGTRHEWVINGSMFMWRAGDMGWLWKEFDPKHSMLRSLHAGFLGSDQGYLSHKLVGSEYLGAWGREHGVLSYVRDLMKARMRYDAGRIVFFAGRRKPWHAPVLQSDPWIKQFVNYRMTEAA